MLLRRKYLLVQRDHLTRGISIVSYHWSRIGAAWKARRLTARDRHARQARPAPPWTYTPGSRFSWEVDTRCN